MTAGIPFFVGVLGRALGRAGRRDAAQRTLEELLERSRSGYVSPTVLAMIHDCLGEVTEGIAALEQDLPERGGACVPPLTSPAYSALQDHPRFGKMLRSVGYTGPWGGSAGMNTTELRPPARS